MPTNVSVTLEGTSQKSSSVYQEFLAERDEILKHKWIESEKAGHDVGFEFALTDWIMNHRSKWRRNRRKKTRPESLQSFP